MRMTIERMHISNFKGVRELTLDFGNITHIRGMNGTGKTTIPDAFSWVLWNKDSRGNTPGSYDFREKPLDEHGEEIHNLDTTVELFCRLDDQPFNLRRTQRENWVKKRGSADAVYQGNVSTYWINDVETKLSDFKARISQIAPEEVFRLVGSLSAFNALDWKKRREQLIALSDVDVDASLMQREEYRPLADECAQRGVAMEDMRKILTDQRKRSNDELRMIPVRIDEARKALPDLSSAEISDAEYIVRDTLKDIESINEYIAEAKSQTAASSNRDQILALETEAVSLQRTISDSYRAEMKRLELERSAASDAFRRASTLLTDTKRRLESAKKELETAEADRAKLLDAYRAEYERKFIPPETESVCPTCGQQLPEEMIQAALQKAQAQFHSERLAKLSDIKARGKDKANDIAIKSKLVENYEADTASLQAQLEAAETERDAIYEKIKAMPQEPDFSKEPRIDELRKQIDVLRQAQSTSPADKIKDLEARKADLNATLERNRAIIARRDAGIETQNRIKALEEQQKTAAARVAEVEQLITLTERFVQDRCSLLEESINDKFPSVRWKLFERQINGAIVDTCQAFVPGTAGLVPYGTANTAAQINADVEIVNVLSQHYDVSLPLFADNSERVNTLAHTDSQLISLSVSTDEDLKIETVKEAM